MSAYRPGAINRLVTDVGVRNRPVTNEAEALGQLIRHGLRCSVYCPMVRGQSTWLCRHLTSYFQRLRSVMHTPSQTPRVVSLDHIQLAMPRGEEQSARAFYSGVLGLAEIPKPVDRIARGGVWFLCGEVQVHLGIEEPFRPAKKAHPAFLVDDLAGLIISLRDTGIEEAAMQVENTSTGARIFTEDPFGNRIELIQASGSATL